MAILRPRPDATALPHPARSATRSRQPVGADSPSGPNDTHSRAADSGDKVGCAKGRAGQRKATAGNAVHIGHSGGGSEAARYPARAEPGRVARLALLGAVPPVMLQTDANPDGLPREVFDGFRSAVALRLRRPNGTGLSR